MTDLSFGGWSRDLENWATTTFRPEDELLRCAREAAEGRGLTSQHLQPFDARDIELITRLLHAGRAIEIGSVGGYSGLAIARALRPGGRLHTFELDPHRAEVTRQAFATARLNVETVVHAGPAMENLPRILSEGPFDLMFLDGDRANYLQYLKWAADHLRVGGALIANGVFVEGQVARPYDVPPENQRLVSRMREFTHEVAASPRFRTTLLPSFEGLLVAVKVS